MTIFEICSLLILLGIAALFVSIINTIKNGNASISITLKIEEPAHTVTPVPPLAEVDPEQANIMNAAFELQKLFLDDNQMVNPKKEARNG